MSLPPFRALALLLLVGQWSIVAAAAHAADTYRFTHRTQQEGDQSVQHVQFDLDLTIKIKKDGLLIDASKKTLQRRQRRRLTLLERDKDDRVKARLTYDIAEESVSSPPVDHSQDQPVAGKTYLVTRAGDELTITHLDGSRPAPDELAIVARNMEMLGQPNPIGQFFDGRAVAVGERLRLPNHLAQTLLGLDANVGEIADFQLTFQETRQIAGERCAVFDTRMVAKSDQATSLAIEAGGELVLEIDTCRAVSMHLRGPVRLSENRGSGEGRFVLDSHGTILVVVEALYPTERF